MPQPKRLTRTDSTRDIELAILRQSRCAPGAPGAGRLREIARLARILTGRTSAAAKRKRNLALDRREAGWWCI